MTNTIKRTAIIVSGVAAVAGSVLAGGSPALADEPADDDDSTTYPYPQVPLGWRSVTLNAADAIEPVDALLVVNRLGDR